jgi:hypothetical protein
VLAATDPDRAERIARSITKNRQASALSDVAVVLAATDPDRAAQLLTDAEDMARSSTDQIWTVRALISIAAALPSRSSA